MEAALVKSAADGLAVTCCCRRSASRNRYLPTMARSEEEEEVVARAPPPRAVVENKLPLSLSDRLPHRLLECVNALAAVVVFVARPPLGPLHWGLPFSFSLS